MAYVNVVIAGQDYNLGQQIFETLECIKKAFLTSITDRVQRIRTYPQLAIRLLGREVTAPEVESFSAAYRKPLDPLGESRF